MKWAWKWDKHNQVLEQENLTKFINFAKCISFVMFWFWIGPFYWSKTDNSYSMTISQAFKNSNETFLNTPCVNVGVRISLIWIVLKFIIVYTFPGHIAQLHWYTLFEAWRVRFELIGNLEHCSLAMLQKLWRFDQRAMPWHK